MTHLSWSARTSLGLKSLAAVLLLAVAAGCGSSKKYDEFMPTRILSIGDAVSYMDLRSTRAPNFANALTVSDSNINFSTVHDHWLRGFAASYGLTKIGAPGSTGTNVIAYNSRTDAGGSEPSSSASPQTLGTINEVRAQADLLTSSADGDLVVISIGMGDIFKRADELALTNALTTSDDATAKDIGLQYANLADSLYQRGFKHVLIVTALDFSQSPYAYARSQVAATSNYSANIAALTEALNKGVNVNCNGGCSLGESKPYPSRNAGVWKYNAYDLLRNVTQGKSPYLVANINSTQPVCATGFQTCSAKASDNFLNLNPTYLIAGSTTSSLYDSNKYFFAGDLFPTPVVHQFMGANMYAYTRGFSGF